MDRWARKIVREVCRLEVVTKCFKRSSSPWPWLSETTCELVKQRKKFRMSRRVKVIR